MVSFLPEWALMKTAVLKKNVHTFVFHMDTLSLLSQVFACSLQDAYYINLIQGRA